MQTLKKYQQLIVMGGGCVLALIGYWIEYLVTLDGSVLGLPNERDVATWIGVMTFTPIFIASDKFKKLTRATSILIAMFITTLFLAGDYIGQFTFLIDPSFKNAFPMIHGFSGHWYFYLAYAAATVAGSFLPHHESFPAIAPPDTVPQTDEAAG